MALFYSLCLPSGKAGGLHIPVFHGICDPHCQGIAVADYSFTLDALLERSGNPVSGASEALQLLQRWGKDKIPSRRVNVVFRFGVFSLLAVIVN